MDLKINGYRKEHKLCTNQKQPVQKAKDTSKGGVIW